jgi:hypothetical protein
MTRKEEREMLADVRLLKTTIMGNGGFGLSQKVNVMWRVHVWLLCSASAVLGAGATALLGKLLK